MSKFNEVAKSVGKVLESRTPGSSNLNRVASSVMKSLGGFRVANEERNAEWQRVNALIADVLKDAHVLYSKMARLQGDFTGDERDELEDIAEQVLSVGRELSDFMTSFHDGNAEMVHDVTFGSPGGAPEGTPNPEIPVEFEERGKVDFSEEVDSSDDENFAEFEEEEEKEKSGGGDDKKEDDEEEEADDEGGEEEAD